MAKTGLEFAENAYDRDRYERTMSIAEGIAAMTIDAFTPERPYLGELHIPSPKVGCSVAAFDDAGRVVLIKRADNGRWALPGGYAEVGSPPSTNALRELHEETGLERSSSTAAWAKPTRQQRPQGRRPKVYICCFRGKITGGSATPSDETPEVVLAEPGELPESMSLLQRTMIADSLLRDAPAVHQ